MDNDMLINLTESEQLKVDQVKQFFQTQTKALKSSIRGINKEVKGLEKEHKKVLEDLEKKLDIRHNRLVKFETGAEKKKNTLKDALRKLEEEESELSFSIDTVETYHDQLRSRLKTERESVREKYLSEIQQEMENGRRLELSRNRFGTKERADLVQKVSSMDVRLRLQEEERLRWDTLAMDVKRRMEQKASEVAEQAEIDEANCTIEEEAARQAEVTPLRDQLAKVKEKRAEKEAEMKQVLEEDDITREKLTRDEDKIKEEIKNSVEQNMVQIKAFQSRINETNSLINSMSKREKDELYCTQEEILSKREWNKQMHWEAKLMKTGQAVARPWKNSYQIMWPMELLEKPFHGGRTRQKEFKFPQNNAAQLPDINKNDKTVASA